MPGTIADLRAKVSIDGAAQAKKDLADLKGKSGSSGGGILGLADSFKLGLGAVTGFLTGFVGFQIAGDALGFVKDQLLDVLQAGMDQQKVMAQTAAVIKSTGGAAHISADQVGELSDHMAQLTGISDDQVQSMVNVLLTFTNLKGNIPQVTQTVLDVATAMHEDLQSAAVQVGKALNDPATGMTALQRIGVTFTQSQKDAAAQMEKTGNMAGAQAIVMKELTKEFGGSAAAAGQTLPGQLARLNVSWDQAKEKIGLAVIPILQKLLDEYVMPLADWLGKFLPVAITTLTGFLDKQLMPAINRLANSPVVTTIEGWALAIANKLDPELNVHLPTAANKSTTALKSTNDHLNTLADTAAGPYVTKSQKAIDKIDQMTNSLGGTTPTGTGLNPAILRVNSNLDKMDSKLNASAAQQAKSGQQTKFLGGVFDGLGNAIAGATGWLSSFGQEIGPKLGPALDNVHRILDGLRDRFSTSLDGLRNMWDGFWNILTFPVRFAADGVRTEVNILLDGLRGNWKQMGKDWQDGAGRLGGDVKNFFGGIGNFILGAVQVWIGNITAPFKQAWATLKPVLDNFGAQLRNWWNNLLASLQQFINDHVPHLPAVTLPNIFNGGGSGHAAGTLDAPPGLAWVGERGPELMAFRGGERVYNHQQSMAMASQATSNSAPARSGGDTYNITIVGANKSASQLFDEMKQEADRRKRMHG